MTIEPASTQDSADIHRIARENGLSSSWVWPTDCHGGVAKHEGRVVAFCALKEVTLDAQPLLALEEMWAEDTTVGRWGLGRLAAYVECLTQHLSNDRGVEVKIGGFVRRESMAQGLKKRGYTVESGELLTKTYYPKGHHAQAKSEVA